MFAFVIIVLLWISILVDSLPLDGVLSSTEKQIVFFPASILQKVLINVTTRIN